MKRLNYNKENSNNDHHHGFKLFEVSGLSHEAAATLCFHHDCAYLPEPCTGMASVSKRPREEPLKEYHIDSKVCEAEVTLTLPINKICKPCYCMWILGLKG